MLVIAVSACFHQATPFCKFDGNVGIEIVNHPFLMVYTTYLWLLGGWFIIAVPTLLLNQAVMQIMQLQDTFLFFFVMRSDSKKTEDGCRLAI